MSQREARTKDVKELEGSLLSCLFALPSVIRKVSDIVSTEDFLIASHKAIYEAILTVARNVPTDETIDYDSVWQELVAMSATREAGGPEYLLTISLDYAPDTNPITYALQVQREARQRRIAVAVQHLQILSQPCSREQEEEALKSIRLLADTIYAAQPDIATRNIASVSVEYLKDIEAVKKSGKPSPALRLGYREIDDLLTGMGRSDLMIVGARPSVGKTAFGTSVLINLLTQAPDTRVFIWTGEMTSRQYMDRIVSSISSVPVNLIRKRAPTSQEFAIMSTTAKFVAQRPIWIDDRPSLNIAQIRAAAMNSARKMNGLDLIIVDYLGLIGSQSKHVSRYQEVSEISRQLKRTAKDMTCPVIALCQLSRDSEKMNKRPHLSDLRDSGEIENDADQVLLLHNPGFYDPDRSAVEDIEVFVAKNRHGTTGMRVLQFDRARTTFLSTIKEPPADSGKDPFADDD